MYGMQLHASEEEEAYLCSLCRCCLRIHWCTMQAVHSLNTSGECMDAHTHACTHACTRTCMHAMYAYIARMHAYKQTHIMISTRLIMHVYTTGKFLRQMIHAEEAEARATASVSPLGLASVLDFRSRLCCFRISFLSLVVHGVFLRSLVR